MKAKYLKNNLNVYFIAGREETKRNSEIFSVLSSFRKDVTILEIATIEKQTFAEQLDKISEDISNLGNPEETVIVSRSYGSYLLLHFNLIKPELSLNQLFLNPMISSFKTKDGYFGIMPPRYKTLVEAISKERIKFNGVVELHVGEKDFHIDFGLVKLLEKSNKNLSVISYKNEGHTFERPLLEIIISNFIKRCSF
ncbi:MAG: hypothetical protein NTX65_12665 [Ignavibacteriales bacterium]|nr:hypothetical protein [Ignavibacteriales bacterium]